MAFLLRHPRLQYFKIVNHRISPNLSTPPGVTSNLKSFHIKYSIRADYLDPKQVDLPNLPNKVNWAKFFETFSSIENFTAYFACATSDLDLLPALVTLSRLTSLSCDDLPNFSSHLSSLSNLKHLVVDDAYSQITDETFTLFPPQLQSFSCKTVVTFTDEGLQTLFERCTQLTSLAIGESIDDEHGERHLPVTGKSLLKFTNLKTLHTICLPNVSIEDDQLLAKQSPKLEHLEFSKKDSIQDAQILNIVTWTTLTQLKLIDMEIKFESSLIILSRNPLLKKLSLSGCRLIPSEFPTFFTSPYMTNLDLSQSGVDDSELEKITKSLFNLKKLCLNK